jgi:hypothetical protein
MSKCYNEDCPYGFYNEDCSGNCRIRCSNDNNLFTIKDCPLAILGPPQKEKRLMTVEEFEKTGACWLKDINAIKSCPFCGETKALEYDGVMSIICHYCGCTGPDFMPSEEAAFIAWNKRI